ncbi:hypothetical protein CAEBREN_01458 [Caenorhabditis brenneri]|uniref:SCP domain-containing protein n=1 Tax=Caenorhabditis brenneri TaxID=135651 RepID=G0PA81_CAEBE|nr:hypothetical protein CAEBREN_01458 [Caenorhabditis brenneri]
MKLPIFIIVLLSAELSKADIIASCDKDDFQLDGQISSRITYASVYKIANMYEVKHDPRLEKIARENFKSCSDYKHGKNFRVLGAPHEKEYDAIFKKHLKAANYTDLDDPKYQEALHPLQYSFIICRLKVNCSMPVEGGTLKSNTVAFYGPQGTLSPSDLKVGPPGSQCPYGKAERGLCIAWPRGAGSSTDSKTGPPSAQCPNGECIAESKSGQRRDGMEAMIYVFFLIASLSFV